MDVGRGMGRDAEDREDGLTPGEMRDHDGSSWGNYCCVVKGADYG